MIAGERIAALQQLVRRVPVSDHCIDYAMDLVRATRGPEHGGPKYIGDWVAWGAGPRAGQSLILAAKARAALAGRPSVSRRRHPGRGAAGAAAPDRDQLQRPGRRRDERLDHQETAGRRPGPEGSRRCRRRGTYSDPDVIAQIADLTLRSRRLVEGAISGQHRSPFHGFNVEFAAYREYTPGDDLRRLDWRVFARSDRHYIKQYEEESNVRVTFVVDASASMNYRGSRAALNKFDYAATLVVSLAMLLSGQQDPVGLVLFDEEASTILPPSATQAQIMVMSELLKACTPARKTELGGLLRSLTDRFRRRGFLVIVSDLFTDLETVYDGLNRLRFLGHEVLVLQVLDRDELDLPFDGPTIFQDIEGDEQVFAEPGAFRRSYQGAMQEFLADVRRSAARRGYDHVCFCTDEHLGDSLGRFLRSREESAQHAGGRS